MERQIIDGVNYGLALSNGCASLRIELDTNNHSADISFKAMAFNEGIEFYIPRQTDVMEIKPDLSQWIYVGGISFSRIQDLLQFLLLFEIEGIVHHIASDFLEEYSKQLIDWYLMNI